MTDLAPEQSETRAAPLPMPAAEPAPAETTPTDLAPTPGRWERLAWYAGSALLSCVLICTGLRLDRADLKAPFLYDLDSLLILPLVKATVERGPGGHWRNERLGAPGILELHDFPVTDHLHFFLIWALGKMVPNVVLLYNLYFLLTFPLTVITAMVVFRHLGLSLPAAATGGLLYSFLPFHYQRWENHYFLAAYWVVPLSLLPAFSVLRGEFPFFRRQPDGTLRLHLLGRASLGYVALGVIVSAAGAYYAFFTCALTAFAGVYAAVVSRKWRAAVAAGGFIAIIVAAGMLNHVPTFVYQAKYGRNPLTERLPEDADSYGMKIAHLVLPITDHNLRVLSRLKYAYNSALRPTENENASASLGAIGTAGLVGLFALLLFTGRRDWPYGPIAALTAFAVLLATLGGLGAVFNLLVTAQIRAYNRISVFIAFLCLFVALWWLDRFLLTRTSRRARRLRYPAWAAVAALGFLDQTPAAWFRMGITQTLDEQAERFRADTRFFGEVERLLQPGSRVFCLPYVPYPESPPMHKLAAYEHVRGYIHTGTLAWSFGAIRGREADVWQAEVGGKVMVARPEEMPRAGEEFLQRLVFRGFDGVLVDARGFPTLKEGNKGTALLAALDQGYAALAGRGARLPRIAHEDGQQFFLDLRPYREVLREKAPGILEAGELAEREAPSILWLGGFLSPEEAGEYDKMRFGPPDGTVWIVNPTDRTRTFTATMTFGTDVPGMFRFRVSGLVDDEFDVDKQPGDWEAKRYGVEKSYRLTVPPGRHVLRIRCTPPIHFVPSDHRKFCYYIKDFSLTER